MGSGDEVALSRLVETHKGAVYGMARRILEDVALAEEVAQDTFLALWRRPEAYDARRGSLRAFLIGIARNKAVDVVRKEESLRRTREALAAEMEATQPEMNDLRIEGVEERRQVQLAVASLSDVQREAVVLAYYGGRTYREVAQELGIPEGTAKTRLRDGLLKLRATIDRDGGI